MKQIKISTVVGLLLIGSFGVFSQGLWPGDVDDNGIVDTDDVLYWALANGFQGPPRFGASMEWSQQLSPSGWKDKFKGNLSYAYADCNGDGFVDKNDLKVIRKNYGRSHGKLKEKPSKKGNGKSDPSYTIDIDPSEIKPGNRVKMKIGLGSEKVKVKKFLGTKFTLFYNPVLVNGGLNLELIEYSWIFNQAGKEDVVAFVMDDPNAGQAEVAITKTNQQETEGFGDFAVASIVIEDIIVSLSVDDLGIGLDSARLVAEDLEEVSVVGIPPATSGELVTSTKEVSRIEQISAYPNPTSTAVRIQLNDSVHLLELVSLDGRVLNSWPRVEDLQVAFDLYELDLSTYPRGQYLIRAIGTDKTFVSKCSKW